MIGPSEAQRQPAAAWPVSSIRSRLGNHRSNEHGGTQPRVRKPGSPDESTKAFRSSRRSPRRPGCPAKRELLERVKRLSPGRELLAAGGAHFDPECTDPETQRCTRDK